jgi:hypothetical protein
MSISPMLGQFVAPTGRAPAPSIQNAGQYPAPSRERFGDGGLGRRLPGHAAGDQRREQRENQQGGASPGPPLEATEASWS